VNRREALAGLGALAAMSAARPAAAQTSQLPLKTPGLEHLGLTVPNPEETAKFYGRIFNPQLFREKDPPPRYYVTLGTAYAAFGGMANAVPKIDHFCAIVQDYKAQDMRKDLADAGITLPATGGFGMIGDPDGLRLQLLNVPGGLAGTIVPGGRISLDPPALHPIGLDHIMLAVSDLDKSAAFYQKIFGKEASRTSKPARVWFQVGNTKLGLEAVNPGEQPRVDHCCLKIVGFDQKVAASKLKALGAETAPSNDEKLLRVRDLHGILWELTAG
jgi:catechol 2,3-dioxygenase-like lactoylglutathione lyase family enzyme